jgi:hypothetical protein
MSWPARSFPGGSEAQEDAGELVNRTMDFRVPLLKKMEFYDQLREIEVTQSPHRTVLSQIALNQLADQWQER